MVYDIALTLIPGLGVKGAIRMIEVFVSAENIFRASRQEIVHYAQINNERIIEAIVSKSTLAAAQKELEHCRKNNITPIASTNPSYPPLLRATPDHPHVIYVMGNIEALTKQCVSIVGTRRMSPYGNNTTTQIVNELASINPNVVIVSGLAFGIDSSAHRAAIHNNIPTVAVIANPLPQVTPSQHTALAKEIIDKGGAIVSEYHSQTKQKGAFYIARNRIIAALSEVTILVESPPAGGAMITADIASGYNRAVAAVPGRITDQNSQGCNNLINSNIAHIYLSAKNLARQLMWDCPQPADRHTITSMDIPLSKEQQGVLNCFRNNDIASIEELAELSGLEITQLLPILTEMELLGAVQMLPGNRCEKLSVSIGKG